MRMYYWISISVSIFVVLLGFWLFSSYTGEMIASLFAAILAGLLMMMAFLVIGWLVQSSRS